MTCIMYTQHSQERGCFHAGQYYFPHIHLAPSASLDCYGRTKSHFLVCLMVLLYKTDRGLKLKKKKKKMLRISYGLVLGVLQ